MTEETYITILGNKISYTDDRYSINELKFHEKNPRVLSKIVHADRLDADDEEQRQKLIQKKMRDESSVKNLTKTIQSQGGISDPLIVQVNTLAVLEGNSRLAALRILYKRTNKEIYLTAPCRMVQLKEGEIDAFLYQQHVEGKTQWSAYDKAYSAYHRVIIDQVQIDDYVQRTSASKRDINSQIEIISLMNDEDAAENTERFSHYDVIVRSSNLKQSFDSHPTLKRHLLDKIKEEPLTITAHDLRDKVPQIAKKSKVLKKWMNGTIDFDEAVEASKISQPKQHMTKAIKSLKEIEKKDIKQLHNNERGAFKPELRKSRKRYDPSKYPIA